MNDGRRRARRNSRLKKEEERGRTGLRPRGYRTPKRVSCFLLLPSSISPYLVLGPGCRSVLWKHPDGAGKPAPSAPAVRGNPDPGRRFGEESPDTLGQDSRQETLSRRHGWPQGRRPEALPFKPGHGGSSRRDGQCHRENTASSGISNLRFEMAEAARVKRWGKSPPRRQRCRWQGKPNPVQDKIGDWAARPTVPGMSHPASAGRPRERPREMTITLAQAGVQNPAYGPKTKACRTRFARCKTRMRQGEKPLDLPGGVGMFDGLSSRSQHISHHPWPTPNPPSKTPANP